MMISLSSTAHFAISYDDSITTANGYSSSGLEMAQDMWDYCEYDLTRLSMLFGNILPPPASLPIEVMIVTGGAGASNDGVNHIWCYPSPGSGYPLGMKSLMVAELAEIFMNVQGHGWNPGWSNGEALSRVSAQLLYPQGSWLFATGPSWLTSSTRPDWVDNVEHTDQDYVSIACGSLFLNYLAYQLNFRWPDIIAAGAPNTNTLAETATTLGVQNAFNDFSALMQMYFPPGSPIYPPGTPNAQQTDDLFPLGAIAQPVPDLYIRHNLADDGTTHSPPLSSSPDIIVKNAPVANPQATFSTAASIGSATQSDANVLDGQANYVYLRVWNRGGADAENTFATVYWSPPATLVTPPMWNLIGDAYFPAVPRGSTVQVANPGVVWPADQIPAAGHYCFVAAVGNADDPPPNPQTFATFDDYVNYIAANNNIAWRNFNVVTTGQPGPMHRHPFGDFIPLPFKLVGAWDEAHAFDFETEADLPNEAGLALQVADWFGRNLQPARTALERFGDPATDPANPYRVRIALEHRRPQPLGKIRLPRGTQAPSHLLVRLPPGRQQKTYTVAIRQLYGGREVGRITWLLVPPAKG
jgi:hypothetical protein